MRSSGVSGFARGARSAVVWRDGKIRALGTLPGGKISIGLAINAGGTVVGVSQSSDGNRAFEWRNGTMRDLGLLPGGSFSLARGINDEGVIVGQADAEDGTIHATRWANGRIDDLGQITTASGAAAASIAHAVGPDGLVIGYGATDGGALGAVWTGSTPRPVAALTGYAVAQLLGLNGFRQAVGDRNRLGGEQADRRHRRPPPRPEVDPGALRSQHARDERRRLDDQLREGHQ